MGAVTPPGGPPSGPTSGEEDVARLSLTDDGASLALALEAPGQSPRPLATYVYRPRVPADESPRPYLHPVRTRGGTVVTGFRPADHRWHHGLSLALPYVGAANLWGGPTWVREEGAYLPLPVNGSMRHGGFAELTSDGASSRVVEDLTWHDAAGGLLARERRELTFALAGDAWQLRWRSAVVNATDAPLPFGSPATHGRAGAGYAGVFWRCAPAFADAAVVVPSVDGPRSGEDLMGVQSPWMAFTARSGPAATVVIWGEDGASRDDTDDGDAGGGPSAPATRTAPSDPTAPSAPTWFARSREYPGFGPAPFFAQEASLAPGAELQLACRFVVADGGLDDSAW